MPDIKVTVSNGKVSVVTPYRPDFPRPAKNLGGRWNPTEKAWVFDARDEKRVRALVREYYGTDGEEPVSLVTLRVRADHFRTANEMWLVGRRVAHRAERDFAVRLGEGCILIEGGFPSSGGSRKNPSLNAREGTIIEIRDVPASLAAEATEDTDALWIVGDGESEETAKKKAELEARKAALLSELAEVEAELKALNGNGAAQAPSTALDRVVAGDTL